jgi:hypothetical protein
VLLTRGSQGSYAGRLRNVLESIATPCSASTNRQHARYALPHTLCNDRPMNKSRRVALIPLLATAYSVVVSASESSPESLPEGAISISDMSGVRAEICRDHLFDPAAVTLRLPNGFHLRTAEEMASKDPTLANLLQINPGVNGYGFGSICFLSATRFAVDGVKLSGVKPMAFWWAAASGPTKSNMRGKVNWIQIGSWYSKGNRRFEGIRRTDPMAQFADIVVKQIAPDAWRLSLTLPHETLSATVRTTSPSTPSKNKQPAFMSVLMSGDSAEQFTVYRYEGHEHRNAEGTWHATGTGAFSAAFAIPNESTTFATIFQSGWTARSGLYRVEAD